MIDNIRFQGLSARKKGLENRLASQRLALVLCCIMFAAVLGTEALAAPKALLIVVDSGTSAQLCSEYAPWKEALQAQGYMVIEQTVDGASVQPPDIRALIRQVYERGDIALEGAILIGAIPAAYAIIHTGDYSNSQAQIAWLSLDAVDMYYEDLDGVWEGVTPEQLDGLVANPPPYVAEVHLYETVTVFRDKHIVSLGLDHEWNPWDISDKTQYEIEIWVSRIMTHNLDVPGVSAMDLMNCYFATNVAVRSEAELVESMANILCSGEGYNDQGMDYSALFARTEMQEKVSKVEYLQVLAWPEGSALTYLTAHSCPVGHAMYESWLGVDELLGCVKTSVFYLLNACSSCRWDWSELQSAAPAALVLPEEPATARNGTANYLGGVYIFDRPGDLDNRGLAAVGFSGVGGFNNLYKFTEAYQPGKSYGVMFTEWFNFNLAINFSPHNYVILGDPSFTPRDGVYSCTAQDTLLAYDGWHMVSVPGRLCEPCTWTNGEVCGDLVCALADDLDPCYIFHYDPGVGGYVMAPPPENICYHTGMGFWTRTYENNVAIDAEVQVPTEAVEIPLGNGWNQIGNPFNFGVELSNLTVKYGGNEASLQQAQSNGWVSAYLFGYDASSGGYQMINPPDDCLAAWHGYWLRAYRDGCALIIPPTECSSSAPAGQPLSTKELQARGLELPPPPPNDLMDLDVKEMLAGLTVRNVPNPVRSEHTTTFKVEGKAANLVLAMRVDIYDQRGQLVFTQEIAAKELAWHTVNDTGELLANGVYLYQVWVKIGDTWYPTGVRKLAVVR